MSLHVILGELCAVCQMKEGAVGLTGREGGAAAVEKLPASEALLVGGASDRGSFCCLQLTAASSSPAVIKTPFVWWTWKIASEHSS